MVGLKAGWRGVGGRIGKLCVIHLHHPPTPHPPPPLANFSLKLSPPLLMKVTSVAMA